MPKRAHFYVFLFLTYFVSISAKADFIYKSFDESMHAPQQVKNTAAYKLSKKIYQTRNPRDIGNKRLNLIPKTIHQIWLGPRKMPQEYLENSQKWRKLHSNWEYKLWREEDLKDWNFKSKDLFNKASSYQEKADILRYEILNKYGGLYVDMDYRPLKNFDEIHEKYFFYGSIEPSGEDAKNITIANSIIASAPNNKIFSEALSKIHDHWNYVEESFREEAENIKGEKNLIHLAVNRTMMPFNKSVLDNIEEMENTILFPTSYMSIEERDKLLDKPKAFLGIVSNKLYFRIPKEETMAVQKRGKRIISNLANIKLKESWWDHYKHLCKVILKKFT